jgi:hypothetical protein
VTVNNFDVNDRCGLVVCQRKGKLGLLNTSKQMKKPIDANVSYRIFEEGFHAFSLS